MLQKSARAKQHAGIVMHH